MKVCADSAVSLTLLFLISLYGCSGPHDAPDESVVDRASDEVEIRSVLASNFAASTALDPAGVQATYMPDGDAWIAGLARFSANEISSAEEEYQSLPGFQGFDGQVKDVRFISRDAAIVEMAATTVLGSGRFDEETTIVVARTPSGWRIAAWRVMTVHPTILEMLRQ